MKDYRQTPQFQDQNVEKEVKQLLDKASGNYHSQEVYSRVLAMIDLTTLEGSDTRARVEALCQKATSFSKMGLGLEDVAAVCVYPTMVDTAKKALQGSDLKIASVAGAFPAGQSALHIKVSEVKYAIDQGADEIDMVISRGKFLEGEYNFVFDEIAAIKQACGQILLKVILETGELKTATYIRRASQIAIDAGADFIKTSTGKVQPAATLEASWTMMQAILEHHNNTGKITGFKPAGGIADPETAFYFYLLAAEVLGEKWINKQYLRFGASRLADQLADAIRGVESKDKASGY
jgi:deoxyribose-phosphate aldolase